MSEHANIKIFFKYISLNIVGMLGISCYILADTFFVANGIGTNGLAALNLAIPIYSFIHGCGLMLGIGGATKFTIAKSQGEHHRANLIFTNSLLTALLFALIFVLTGLLCSKQLTTLLGADSTLFEMTNIYLKVILLFSPFFILNELLLSFVRNDGAPALAMTAMISGSIANIILDYLFIYSMQMGIFGAVLATGIAPIISITVLSFHKAKNRNSFHLIKCQIHTESIVGSIILGFPSLVSEVSAGLVMIVFNILILNLSGNVGVAAYGIIANISLVTTAIYTGIAQGVQPLISVAYGCGKNNTIQSYLKYAIISVLSISIVIYSGIYLCAEEIALLFNSEQNHQLQTIAEYGLTLYFTGILFTGFNVVISAFFTSTENPLPAHIISLLRGLIIVIPMAFFLSALWKLTGIWLSITATEILVAILAAWLWNKRKR